MHDPAVRDEARAVHVAFAAKVADELAGVLVSGLEIKRYTFLPTLVIVVGQPRKALPETDSGTIHGWGDSTQPGVDVIKLLRAQPTAVSW